MIEDVLIQHSEQLSDAPPVIVIDALDECGTDECHATQHRILLNTLSRWSNLPRSCKLIVTSRDERVPEFFNNPNICQKIVLETGESVGPETQNDIRTFFKQSFDIIRSSYGLPEKWPTESDINLLTKRAAGLFIWARTAITFMEGKWSDPKARLELVLAGDLDKRSQNIDALYQQILDYALRGANNSVLELFRDVVGSVVLAKGTLHQDDLRHFLPQGNPITHFHLRLILKSLSSVIELDGPLRFRHLSFADFLSDASRCRDPRFLVHRDEHSRKMVLSCFGIMREGLKFNICRLESSHFRNCDVPDLSERIAKHVPKHLSYACRYWAGHLCDTVANGPGCGRLLTEVKVFLHVRFLYWLEVMSLLEDISTSSVALLMVLRWTKASTLSSYTRVQNWLTISLRTSMRSYHLSQGMPTNSSRISTPQSLRAPPISISPRYRSPLRGH
jgi:hypothetical protein